MKYLKLNFLFVIILCFVSCKTVPDCDKLLSELIDNLDAGNISKVKELSDSIKIVCSEDKIVASKADSLSQIAERIGIDFSLDEAVLRSRLESGVGPFSQSEIEEWKNKGWLDYRIIDGKKRYFNRAASNLVLIKAFYNGKEQLSNTDDTAISFRLAKAEETINLSADREGFIVPVGIRITYTLTVEPDVVPEGEIVRCWLPWPRSDQNRQSKVKLISTSEQRYLISPDSSVHSTIYMEKVSVKEKPVEFSLSFMYQSSPEYFNPERLTIKPYDKSAALYKKYTSQQLPQICFTENVKRLADSLTAGEEDPLEIAGRIYLWFKENIPWAGALEYSIMPNIPEYVIKNKRGDCGMQTLLFMSMLRYKGIPVRWQSGWMVPPDSENLHDWCEIYYEGTGWVPADVSYDLLPTDNRQLREFYFSGIDAYRLIVNDGISGRLYPEKMHLRSEPYDFQRGEVEWSGGNLYFDKWEYEMEIEYLK